MENIADSKKRKRPARKQASESDVFEDPPHTGFYNIWYDRVQDYSTWRDRRDAKLAGKRFKLDLEKDVGETMAKSTAYICLFFARGKCIHGPECKYKHAIPTYEDEAKLDTFHDVFGRERHR
uniref:C3H1-type domain-containing protein n=1 Tax=Arcella intermedia TaxID=1963864 RepID=A0A6B2LRS3_9EUKA